MTCVRTGDVTTHPVPFADVNTARFTCREQSADGAEAGAFYQPGEG